MTIIYTFYRITNGTFYMALFQLTDWISLKNRDNL